MNDRNKILIIAVAVFIIIAVIVGLKLFGGQSASMTEEEFVAPETDPIDAALEFYDAWFDALSSTTTDPYQLDLLSSPALSAHLSEKLKVLTAESVPDVDPVICQAELPERIGAKAVYETEREAQFMVIPRGGVKVPQNALVTLEAIDGKWVITDITCSNGEIAPDREYSFENEGHLLKDSLPEPLDSQYWHLVFTQNGQAGYTAPLFFDDSSVCVSEDGTEAVCTPDQFAEATKVLVKGEMTEAGANVKRLEFVQ